MLLILTVSFVLGTASAVRAQTVGAVIYDFSGYTLPAGRTAQFAVDAGTMTGLLKKNADGTYALSPSGQFYADESLLSAYVSALAGLYDVQGVNTLDQETEKQYLRSVILSGTSDLSHKPAMNTALTQTQTQTQTQISQLVQGVPGATYILIDKSDQVLYYFVNGALLLTSDVVTGNVSAGHETPTGVFAVYMKQTNRTLKGTGYAAHVDYWMPFYKSYGIHDASWRSSFGGTIYRNSGSHGCVNMPHDKAQLLYSTVSAGTMVIVQE